MRGSQERRGRDLDGLFPAPARRLWRPEPSLRENSVILEGILTSIPEFLTCFLVSMEGLCGWGRVEDFSPAQQLKFLQSLARPASKFLFDSVSGAALRIFGDLSRLQKRMGKRPATAKPQRRRAGPSALLYVLQIRWVQSNTLIRCIVPLDNAGRGRQGQLQAPLMICLEPSSLSLGNLEIRHGAAPGLLNADRPTHLASQS